MDPLAAFQQDAFAGQYLRYRYATRDGRSGLLGCICEEERDHTHSAFHVAPTARQAAEPTRSVVEANGRSSGIEWTGVGADNPLTEVGRLEPLVPQVMLDEVNHGPFEE